MKTLILTIILGLALSIQIKANQDCIWSSSKAGLTIHLVASCSAKNQRFIDSIVSLALAKLNRKDTSLKILVFINIARLSFPNAESLSFFSIGYDTLREIDDDFIFNYYWNKQTISANENSGVNAFDSEKVPIDINSTSNGIRNELGIKIIYNQDYRLGHPDWVNIINSIVYSGSNVDFIKQFQSRDTVRYNTNGWYVSLVTIDTARITRIFGKDTINKSPQTKTPRPTNTFYYLIAALALLIILTLVMVRRKHSR